MANNSIPERKDVPDSDKWDLTTLFKTDEDWEKALSQIVPAAEKLSKFKGKLSLSSGNFLSALKLSEDLWKNAELVGNYAGLQHTADESDSAATDRVGRYSMAYSKASAKLSFFDAEILSIPDEKIRVWTALPEFADYKVYLEKLLYLKP